MITPEDIRNAEALGEFFRKYEKKHGKKHPLDTEGEPSMFDGIPFEEWIKEDRSE